MTATTAKPILVINNRHIEECGEPPTLSERIEQNSIRACYFQNIHGEQFVVLYDLDTDVCELCSGDIGWGEPLLVEEFRGKMLIRFARTQQERDANPKMNTQFDFGSFEVEPGDKEKIEAGIKSAMERIWGKLTDQEYELVTNTPDSGLRHFMNPTEAKIILAFWESCRN